jgi:integrase
VPTSQRSRRAWGAVRRLPSGRWQAKWPNPDTRRLTPAPATFPTKAEADRWLSHKRVDLERGMSVDDRAAGRPLGDWWAGYLTSIRARCRPSTVANYEQAWRLRIAPQFGAIAVRHIRASSVEAWLTAMTASGVSASKVIEAHGVLKRVLDRPVRDGVLAANPCATRRGALPRRPTMDRPVLSPAQVEEFAGQMRRDDDRLLVRTLAYTGLRIGEALALQRGDLDIAARTIRVQRSVDGTTVVGPTKTHASRTVTMPTSLATALASHLATTSGELVFPNRSGGLRRYRTFRRDSWDPAARAAGLAVSPHDLRATCASLLIDAGASIKDVQTQLGHQDPITTLALYARVRPGRADVLADKMDGLIAELS